MTIASIDTPRTKDTIGRYGWIAVIATAIVAAAVYVSDADETRLSVVAVIGYGVLAVLAMTSGVALHRPRVLSPWLLLTLGLALLVVGDIVFEAAGEGPAEFPYLGAYGFLIAGLVLGARYRNRRVDRNAALDAALVAVSAFACLWLLLVDPEKVSDETFTWSTVVNLFVFPVLDVVLVSLILRSAFRRAGTTSVPGALIFGSVAVTAVCDVAVATAAVHDDSLPVRSDTLVTVAYGGFLVAYGLLAAAALHPRMASLYDPAGETTDAGSVRLFTVLTAPVAPLLVAAALAANGNAVPVGVLVVSGPLLFVMAFVRLSGLIKLLRNEARRDEELRRYSERLLTAQDRDEAVAAARSAARRIADMDVELVPVGSAPTAIAAQVEGDGTEQLELAAYVDAHRDRAHALLGVLADGLSVTFARQAAIEREEEALRTLQAQNERLLELDALKQSFISMVSHELRTPLTSIVGYLELLREGEGGELTEDQARFLEVVDRNATRLQRLVDDILTISRADSDRLKLTVEPVDVAQLVQRSAESAGPVAKDKGVELVLRANGELPEVEGDRRLLAQLLDNLVSNAVKFTPPGGTVTIRAAPGGEELVVEVTDTGPGIPPDEVPRLFERFFRASTAADVPGTGLGLAISKAIVEAHGGSIGIESALGSGSTFRFVIPRFPPSRAAEPVPDRVEA